MSKFTSNLNTIVRKGEILNFSRKCGISEGTIRGYLKGTSSPNVENLLKIATAGHVSAAWLIGEEQQSKPKKSATIIHAEFSNPSMQEMALWISEQKDGINYWEVAKAKLAMDCPEFKEWLKKHRGLHNQLDDEKLTSNGG